MDAFPGRGGTEGPEHGRLESQTIYRESYDT